ncbi:murein hydrolase activator EnvC family protein [Paracoccus aerius]
MSATAGTAVKAAGSGTVAAVTQDTAGTPIVVVRHDGNLMTVYTGLDGLDVAKGDRVSGGQSIGTAGRGGFVHFEVRQGFDSVDPEKYIN